MSLDKNTAMNAVYNAGLITLGAIGTSMVTKKLASESLGFENKTNVKDILRLIVAVSGGSLLVKYLQMSDVVPEKPWKE